MLAIVEAHLPDYLELRKRFPLWTYARHGRSSWLQSRALFERLRWSQRFPYVAVYAALDRELRHHGFTAPAGAFNDPSDSTLRAFDESGLVELEIPAVLRARTIAIFAAMDSPKIPATAAAVRFPKRWRYGWIDDMDRERLAEEFVRVLTQRWPFAKREGFDLPPDAPLLSYFLDLALRHGARAEAAEILREQGRALMEQLGRAVGLLLKDRQGGRKGDLEDPVLEALRKEIEGLVPDVLEYRPDPARLEMYRALLEADDSPSERFAELDGAVRGLPPPEDLVLLRYPFLTPPELRLIRSPGLVRKDKRTPTVRLRNRLLNGRLTVEMSPDTIRRRLRQPPKTARERKGPGS